MTRRVIKQKGFVMEKEKINRINELAKKKKSQGLTEAEQAEQNRLRQEYISEFKASLTGQLDNMVIEKPDGTRAERVPKDKWPRPWIDSENCVGCSLCIEDCPKFCLELTEPKFHGDIRTFAALKRPEDCIGCGICSRRCPIEAIVMLPPAAVKKET